MFMLVKKISPCTVMSKCFFFSFYVDNKKGLYHRLQTCFCLSISVSPPTQLWQMAVLQWHLFYLHFLLVKRSFASLMFRNPCSMMVPFCVSVYVKKELKAKHVGWRWRIWSSPWFSTSLFHPAFFLPVSRSWLLQKLIVQGHYRGVFFSPCGMDPIHVKVYACLALEERSAVQCLVSVCASVWVRQRER